MFSLPTLFLSENTRKVFDITMEFVRELGLKADAESNAPDEALKSQNPTY